MIKELANFIERIESDVLNWNIKPSNGLHIFLRMNDSKNFEEIGYLFLSNKKSFGEANSDLERITEIETLGRRIGTNMNKAFHKKLFACNPFIISFKKKNYSELSSGDFDSFFNVANRIAKLNINEINIADKFKDEVLRLKREVVKSLKITTSEKENNVTQTKEETIFPLLGKEDYINFYLISFPNEDGEIQDTDFKKYHDRYLEQKGFNQDKVDYKLGHIKKETEEKFIFHDLLFQKQLDENKKATKEYSDVFTDEYNGYYLQNNFGISDYLNGLNSKKPYLEHKTAMFQKGISQFIDGDMAKALIKFEQLVTINKILPNPLPIMIWHENDSNDTGNGGNVEQNVFLKEYNENISIIKDKETRIGFTEVLNKIFEKNISFKLSNFYLFNFTGGKLRDFDFVEEFKFGVEGLEIINIFNNTGTEKSKLPIRNVFDFERKIVMPLFDNGLVTEYLVEDNNKKDHRLMLFKYFDDLKESNYSGSMFLLVSKYRRAFYDYIYKSQRNALNANIIKEILTVGLKDDIYKDKFNNGKHSNQLKILNKLNIWFSVYDYFLNNKKNDNTMASKIDQFRNDLIEIIKGNRSLNDGEDELFAFVAGQVVYYIQSKTRSADKSYARLEPFLNKTRAKEFKLALKEEFEKYKHERYSNEFNLPFAQVNVYPISNSMKDLLPFFLGGYFFKNLLFPGAINEISNN